MLFERNKPFTNETLLDKENILELIQFERFCRDNSLWDSMYQCFSEDSTVNISWFKGSGAEFVESSKEMNRYAPHQIYNSQIWINQHRAVAIMQATIQTRLPIDDVQMQLNSDAKIVYGLVKEGDTWYIQNMECVYEKDSLTPVVPSTITIPDEQLQAYRSSYACLSYCLNYIGYSVNHELQGIDRPEQLNDYYQRLDQWLTYQNDTI
ncbi:nuclear transport factor 2 family protein [Staphylococcus pasteuri]|uniref:nuclear transport factor 2 family protein n=1 Tax=Staphylococcus pasteuri TaxID=45972 RepID=UPI000E69DD04|nr:nuclear transport factor 2 family protein [Staphylococcus pasteuri]MCT1926802.1 nuclear transport factor 2 family protein [Staphylococcus pasteuri]RIO53678.1 bile acid 7-alpha dehydratase [Staphylococcus pasteuri]